MNKQTKKIASFLDKFERKSKYSQNYSYLIYDEATSGEVSPKEELSNSLDDEMSSCDKRYEGKNYNKFSDSDE